MFAGIEDHLAGKSQSLFWCNKGAQQLDEVISLKTETLTSILDKHNCPRFIEYITIDTEGSDIEVLKGLDLDKYAFGYMTIEARPIGRILEVLAYLKPYGFCLKTVSYGPHGAVLDAHFVQCNNHYEKYDRQFADSFIDKNIDNKKASNIFSERFVDILSDPSNMLIPRCKDAGKVIGDNIVMHNNLLVHKGKFYGKYDKILELNEGVHEPAEERMFAEVLNYIPQGGTIIELGSYWAVYSMWFYKKIADAKVYCIERYKENIRVGVDNFHLNGVKGNFTLGAINKDIFITEFIKEKDIDIIDILHSDIEGHELKMLESITELLESKRIRYLFISTHSNKIHTSCLELLQHHGYRIIADADYDNETFCWDGLIVACPGNDLDIPYTSLGSRRHTPLNHTGKPLNNINDQ